MLKVVKYGNGTGSTVISSPSFSRWKALLLWGRQQWHEPGMYWVEKEATSTNRACYYPLYLEFEQETVAIYFQYSIEQRLDPPVGHAAPDIDEQTQGKSFVSWRHLLYWARRHLTPGAYWVAQKGVGQNAGALWEIYVDREADGTLSVSRS